MKQNKDQIEVLQKEGGSIVERAEELKIVDQKSMGEAAEVLSGLNKFLDKVTAEKEKVTKPLNEALKAERGRWKPVEAIYEAAIEKVRAAMMSYQTAETKRAREEEAAIAARVGEGKGKLKMETAVKKMGEVDRAAETVSSAAGTVKFREKQVVVVIDEALIPREYMIVDEAAILVALKAGVVVPGTVLDTVQVPVNFR